MATTIRVWNGTEARDYVLDNYGKVQLFVGSGADADIRISAAGVAAKHGCFFYQNGVWYYQDMNSQMGTSLDGSRVSTHQVAGGNVLVLGEVKGTETICMEVISAGTASPKQETSATPQSRTVQPQPGYGQATQTQTSQSQTVQPQTGYGQATQTQTSQSQTVQPQSGYGQATQTQTFQSQAAQPQSGYGQAARPQTSQNQTVQPQAGYGQAARPQTPQGQTAQSQSGYGQAPQRTQQTGFGQIPQGLSGYGQGTPRQTYGQPGQQPPQRTQQSTPPADKGGKSGKSKALIISLACLSAALLTVVLLFAFGVFGSKEGGETPSSTSASAVPTEQPATTSTEKATETEKPTEAVTEPVTEASTEPATEPVTEPATETPEKAELDSEEIYKIALQSTVEVQAESDTYGSVGTGFFDDDHGTVVTNYHVIDGMTSAVILTSTGAKYNVTKVLGYDTDLDIAILETDIGTSVPLTRRTDQVNTGEKVYALGSSQGYFGTFTEGVVSTAERIEEGHKFIQHSAPITNGNSGGPLLDKYAQVMGINNWMRLDGQNLNFAIPVDQVDQVPRNNPMTMAEVQAKEYGNAGSGQTTFTGENTFVLDELDSGVRLEISVPDGLDLDQETGEVSYINEAGNAGLYIDGYLEEGYVETTLDDMAPEILQKLEEELIEEAAEENITFQDVSSNAITIDGRYWYVYTTYGYMENEYGESYIIDFVYLVGLKVGDGELATISMVSLFTNDESFEENYYEIEELEEMIISSIRF